MLRDVLSSLTPWRRYKADKIWVLVHVLPLSITYDHYSSLPASPGDTNIDLVLSTFRHSGRKGCTQLLNKTEKSISEAKGTTTRGKLDLYNWPCFVLFYLSHKISLCIPACSNTDHGRTVPDSDMEEDIPLKTKKIAGWLETGEGEGKGEGEGEGGGEGER